MNKCPRPGSEMCKSSTCVPALSPSSISQPARIYINARNQKSRSFQVNRHPSKKLLQDIHLNTGTCHAKSPSLEEQLLNQILKTDIVLSKTLHLLAEQKKENAGDITLISALTDLSGRIHNRLREASRHSSSEFCTYMASTRPVDLPEAVETPSRTLNPGDSDDGAFLVPEVVNAPRKDDEAGALVVYQSLEADLPQAPDRPPWIVIDLPPTPSQLEQLEEEYEQSVDWVNHLAENRPRTPLNWNSKQECLILRWQQNYQYALHDAEETLVLLQQLPGHQERLQEVQHLRGRLLDELKDPTHGRASTTLTAAVTSPATAGTSNSPTGPTPL